MPHRAGQPDDLPTSDAKRAPASWGRDDSIVVLASYFERPRDALVPPAAERDRVANLLGQSVEEVTRRYWMFAAIDPDSKAEGEAGQREQRLWVRFHNDRMALMVAADEALERRRSRPRRLYGDP